MSDRSLEPESSGDDLLDRLVAEFLADVEAGRTPDRARILKEHSPVADELKQFFENHDRMTNAADADLSPMPAQRTYVPNSSAELNTPPPGAVLRYFGDYELLEEIDRGGMGIVYKARQVQLRRIVAVKMILSGALATSEDVRRFRSEAEAAAALQHPAIVPVHEVGEFEGQHFYSMGYVDGSSLARALRDGPLPQRQTAELICIAADAVQHAHNCGVIHRDLKPANILLDQTGRPHVTDFGLARRLAVDQSLTPTGEILGTPGYMPPEQAQGRNSDVREAADVYSLGAILYASLTGRPPFQADNPMDTLLQVIEREPVSPRQLNPAVSRDLETICLKCLQKDRTRRYSSARELADDLQRFLNGEAILARPVSAFVRLWKWTRRNRAAAALTLALVLTLISGTAFSSWFAWRATRNEARAVRLAAEKSDLARHAVILAGEKEQLARQESRARLTAERQAEATAWNLYVARLFPMVDAWQEHDYGRLETLLEESRPDPDAINFCGWEWYFLQEQVRAASRSLAESKLSARVDLCSATQQVAVAGAHDITVLKIDGEILQRFAVPVTAWRLAWDPAGLRIAFTDHGGRLYILNVEDGHVSDPLAGHSERILSIAWTDDGRRLATAGFRSGMIIVHDAHTHTIINKLPAPSDGRRNVASLDWHPDGVRLAAAFRFNSCGVWSTDNGEQLWSNSRGGATGGPVAWSPDGTELAVGTTIGVYVRDEAGRRKNFTPARRVHSIAWHEDGQRIAFGQVDHSITVWNKETNESVQQRIHQSSVEAIHWIDEVQLMSASGVSGVRIANINHTHNDQPLLQTTGEFLDVSWHPDGQMLAIAPGGKIVDTNTGRVIRSVEGLIDEQPLIASPESSLAFAPNSDRLVAVNRNRATILDTSTGRRIREFSVPEDGTVLQRVFWQAKPNIIHVVNHSGQYNRWDGNSGALIDTAKIRDELWSFDLSPDGTTVASGAGHGFAVEFYSTVAKKMTAHTREQGWIRSIAFHPNGAYVAAGEQIGRVRLIRTSDAEQTRHLPAHQGPVYALRFSPDGNRLASGGDDGILKLWDTNTWQCVISIPLERCIYDVEWSRDGRRLALACDHGAYVFDAHSAMPAAGYSDTVLTAQRKATTNASSVSPEVSDPVELTTTDPDQQSVESAAAAWVLSVGGNVSVVGRENPPVRIEDPEQLPVPPFHISAIDLVDQSEVTNDDLSLIRRLKQIRHLNLRGTSISDEGLRHLTNLVSLETLKLGETAITGTGFEYLSGLTRLRNLTAIHLTLTNETFSNLPAFPALVSLTVSFNKPGIDDRALAASGRFPNLRSLDLLDAVTLSADGLKHISALKNLGILRLHRTTIHDDALRHLANCQNLKLLDLSAVRSVTDSGFQHLTGLKTLEELRVPRTRFSDAALQIVQQLPGLRKLDAAETLVTKDALKRFRQARPDCVIISSY